MLTFAAFLLLGVGLFMMNGLVRGWYRELLATSGIILGLNLLQFVESLYKVSALLSPGQLFMLRFGVLLVTLFLGYQVPLRAYRRGPEGLFSALLGGILAAVNGYLFIGILWYFMEVAHYPWPTFVKPPIDPLSIQLVHHLPSALLKSSLVLRGSLILSFLIVIAVVV